MTIPIRIECDCGQPYAFEIEPVNGRMPVPVACPTCGRDGTIAANAVITEALTPSAPPAAPKVAPTEQSPPEGFLDIDFISTFPQAFWVSTIGKDAKAPEGFRYKVLTMRKEPEMTVDIILLRETVDGVKSVVSSKRGPMRTFAMIEGMVQKLGQDTRVTFERFDFSDVRSFEEFRARALASGWETFHAA